MQAEFQKQQAKMTAYLRDPQHSCAPEGIEPRRLAIYQELIYGNLESFLFGAFPVLHAITPNARWQVMVREFLRSYRCQSPYFLTISEEFLTFLNTLWQPLPDDYPFVQELAHYEWVELALTVAEDTPLANIDGAGDLLAGVPVLAETAWPLAYRFPVHLIGHDYLPQQAPSEPTYLVVYRAADDTVGFMTMNFVTARLLALMQEHPNATGDNLLRQIASELQLADPAPVLSGGAQTLNDLRLRGIVLGTRAVKD